MLVRDHIRLDSLSICDSERVCVRARPLLLTPLPMCAWVCIVWLAVKSKKKKRKFLRVKMRQPYMKNVVCVRVRVHFNIIPVVWYHTNTDANAFFSSHALKCRLPVPLLVFFLFLRNNTKMKCATLSASRRSTQKKNEIEHTYMRRRASV